MVLFVCRHCLEIVLEQSVMVVLVGCLLVGCWTARRVVKVDDRWPCRPHAACWHALSQLMDVFHCPWPSCTQIFDLDIEFRWLAAVNMLEQVLKGRLTLPVTDGSNMNENFSLSLGAGTLGLFPFASRSFMAIPEVTPCSV